MALTTVSHSINSSDNSPISYSVLPVLFLPFWSFQLCISLWSLPHPWYNPLWLTGLKATTNQLNLTHSCNFIVPRGKIPLAAVWIRRDIDSSSLHAGWHRGLQWGPIMLDLCLWGAADVEIKFPSIENLEPRNTFSFKPSVCQNRGFYASPAARNRRLLVS